MDIERALTATIVGVPEDTERDVAAYFHPDYVQTTDGVVSDHAQFVRHIRHVRSVIARADIVVDEVVAAGTAIADRHTVTVVKNDGAVSAFEVLLIGRLAEDGRLLRVNETTRQLSGAPDDADLGSATG